MSSILYGVEPCGCCTIVDCAPESMTAQQKRDLGEFLGDGGTIHRVDSMDEVPRMTGKCPHDPIGWGPDKGRPNPNLQTSLIAELEGDNR